MSQTRFNILNLRKTLDFIGSNMLNVYYQLFESALSKEFCEHIINTTPWGKSAPAKLDGANIKEHQRKGNVYWEELFSPIGCVAQCHINIANSLAGWNYPVNYCERIQMSSYSNGGHYDWHIDSFAPKDGIQRKLSCSIQLNDPTQYKGGELELEIEPGKNLLAKQGSILVFPSFLKHRVQPVTSGTRYAAVTWAYGPAFR